MFKKIVIGISFVVAAVFSTVTIGEDAVIADPQHYTVEFENDRVRVIRIKYGPGEKSVILNTNHSPSESDIATLEKIAP